MATQKVFIPLENNPEVMTALAQKLGLKDDVQFHDLYSLTDQDFLAFIPRPALALLFVYPETDTSEENYRREFAAESDYEGIGDRPVMFFKQTITHACGLIGLLHCTVNGARDLIKPDSDLHNLIKQSFNLKRDDRAQLLHDSDILEAAHDHAAHQGDSIPPVRGDCPPQAFIAFVKGTDGHLYELEGRQKGPIDRGILPESADVLSQEALDLGPLRFIEREMKAGGNVAFSCTVLA